MIENKYLFNDVQFDISAPTEAIDFQEWTKFISYYRYYLDKFAVDILGLKLYPFQRLILRAMARYPQVMLICCRGLGEVI